jgi:hypothetical protein
MHLYLTHRLLAHIYYVKVASWSYPLSLFTTKCDPQRGSIDHMTPHRLDQNHLVKRGSQTACNHKHDYHDSCTHYKGKRPVPTSSDLIAAQATRKTSFLPFLHFLWCTTQRSLHVVTMVYYRSYVKLCQGSTQYHSIAKVSRDSRGTTTPVALCAPGWVTMPNSHSSEHVTLPIASLISKQAIPYRTLDNTCCSGVSTTKTQSLADSSMTNHKPWRS